MAAVFLLSCSSGTSTNGGGGGNGGGDGGDGNGGGGGGTAAAIIANHSIVAAFDLIPASSISQAIANFRIYLRAHIARQPDNHGPSDASEFDLRLCRHEYRRE
jgi:hypothetical protein